MEQDISPGAVKVRQIRGRRTPDGTCRHRFYLGDSRTGSVAVGTCKLCGVQRAFANNYGLALPKGRNMAQNIHTAMVREGRALHGSTGMEGLDLAQAAENFRREAT